MSIRYYATEEYVDNKKTSWNDLEDKPFGTKTEMVEIIATTELTFDEESTTELPPCNLQVGNKYIVNYNNVTYECVAVDADGQPCMGNIGGLSGGESTGEPFVIILVDGNPEMAVCFSVAGDTTATIAIYEEQEVVTKIDPKFVPNQSKEEVLFDLNSPTSINSCNKTYNELLEIFDSRPSIYAIMGYNWFPCIRADKNSSGTMWFKFFFNGTTMFEVQYTASSLKSTSGTIGAST